MLYLPSTDVPVKKIFKRETWSQTFIKLHFFKLTMYDISLKHSWLSFYVASVLKFFATYWTDFFQN